MTATTEILVVPKSEFDLVKAEVKEVNRKFDELLVMLKQAETLKTETYMTTEEACEKYKVSQTTLFERKRKNRINYYQDGRILRWPVSELNKHFKIKI